MNSNRYSIIVPVYNSADYLCQCIDSIILQTIDKYEILLIENGSTDESPRICDQYQDKFPFIKTYHIPNGGLSDARNYGVKCATGNYLVFIDSDDIIKRNTLENFDHIINQYSDVQVITSSGKILIYKNKMFPATYSIPYNQLNGKSGKQWVTYFLQNNIDDWNGPGKCFQKDFWVSNKFMFKVGRLSEDVELIYKVLLKSDYMFCVEPFYYYRQARPDSIITSQNPKLLKDTILNLKEWNIYLENCDFLTEDEKKLFYERFSRQYCTSVLAMIYSFSSSIRNNLKKEALEIQYYLYKGNNNFVKLSCFIAKNISLDFLCICLFAARQIKHFITKFKWMIKGMPLNIE